MEKLNTLIRLMAVALQGGLPVKHKVMSNGEQRFALTLSSDTELILTIAGATGGWQNAHYHGGPAALEHHRSGHDDCAGIQETSMVLAGWMAEAYGWQDAGVWRCEITTLQVGQCTTFLPGEMHNVYVPPRAVILTMKYGLPVGNPDKKGNDWWPAPELDRLSKAFQSEAQILAAASD